MGKIIYGLMEISDMVHATAKTNATTSDPEFDPLFNAIDDIMDDLRG